MIIYRMQYTNQHGRIKGIFMSDFQWDMDVHLRGYHPNPHDDGIKEFTENTHLCGCVSIEQVLEWIDYDDLIRCVGDADCGFELLEVEIDREDVLFGGVQVGYNPEHVKNWHSIDVQDIERIVKGTRYERKEWKAA